MAFSMAIYPAVILTYVGQTAYLINNPEDYIEGFFKMIPRPIFWPMLVISTLAAIVASQRLITATFSIVKQSMALDFFPPVKVVHTSEDSEGQIYSPEVNWCLMVLCCAVVFGFQSGLDIGNAFGT
jgi:KUP system potassium uptake protein